jgi:membrane fusion protein, multidrug efflux system
MRGLWVILALAAAACEQAQARRESDKSSKPGGERPIPVITAAVEQRDVPIYLDGLGTVIAFNTVAVHTQVDGRLLEVRFVEGQDVRRGQLLALVDPDPFQAQLLQAEGALVRDSALLHSSRINLARNQELRRQNLVAQQNVDDQAALVGQYQGAIRVDRGQVANAKLNLKYARIVSPVDGVVGLRLIDPGNVVHAADASGIVMVTQIDPISIVFTLPQDDLPQVARALRQTGALTVEIYSREGNVQLGRGLVTAIDNQINTTTATIRLKATASNPERLLWPNQFVKAHLLVSTRADATVVPSTAVQRGPEGMFAYVVGAHDTVAVRKVQPELTTGDVSIIARGLQPGEVVVTEGQNELSPGSHVAPRALHTDGGAGDGGAPPDGGAAP